MHYVIGDVHGCYDEMMALLEKIESLDTDPQIIFVGDFIDRGPKVDRVLDWCMKNITADGKYRSVRGNHEQMVLEWYQDYVAWWDNGGFYPQCDVPMPSLPYDFYDCMKKMKKSTPNLMFPYMEFFDSLPLSIPLEIETVWGKKVEFRVVHAYYENDPPTEEQQKNSNLWLRMECGNLESDEILVHGHTPTLTMEYQYWSPENTRPGMISYRRNAINLDGGCVFSEEFPMYPDFIGAICLENLQEIYPCTVEERFVQLVTKKTGLSRQLLRAESYSDQYLQTECAHRGKILKSMGHPDYQKPVEQPKEKPNGEPKFSVGSEISFSFSGGTYYGIIKASRLIKTKGALDALPYYDLMTYLRGSFMMCQNIPEKDIQLI